MNARGIKGYEPYNIPLGIPLGLGQPVFGPPGAKLPPTGVNLPYIPSPPPGYAPFGVPWSPPARAGVGFRNTANVREYNRRMLPGHNVMRNTTAPLGQGRKLIPTRTIQSVAPYAAGTMFAPQFELRGREAMNEAHNSAKMFEKVPADEKRINAFLRANAYGRGSSRRRKTRKHRK
jgi:hypothetical protein